MVQESIKPNWPNAKINGLLKLKACAWQGRMKTVTTDEAFRLVKQVRDELTAYYEQRIREFEQQDASVESATN